MFSKTVTFTGMIAVSLCFITTNAWAAVCPCDFNPIPYKEFAKYGIKTIDCPTDNSGPELATELRGYNGKNFNQVRFLAEVKTDADNDTKDRCNVFVRKGKLKRNIWMLNLSDEEAAQCRADIDDYAYMLAGESDICP